MFVAPMPHPTCCVRARAPRAYCRPVELNKFNNEGVDEAPAGRGERTRQLVVDTALRLFREQGYDRTTMRSIATAAGLSPGNAYYYFPSKQHLVQHFYAEIQAAHRERCTELLTGRASLTRRLAGVLHAGVDTMTPYHDFAATCIKVAIDPGSPLSPFSPDSAASRAQSIALFADALRGPATGMDDRLREELPELLWLAYLGLVLFWVYDSSPGQTRTRHLIDAAVPLLVRLLKLTRIPVLRSPTTQLLALVQTARS
jgi:AcrR family transcriptional regulator